jgi:hypothetical protein
MKFCLVSTPMQDKWHSPFHDGFYNKLLSDCVQVLKFHIPNMLVSQSQKTASAPVKKIVP